MSVKHLILTTREKWLEARENHIGGSDAACCLGMNPYKSNVELWEEKTGKRQLTDISNEPYVRYGIDAEPYLREMFLLDYPQYRLAYEEHNMFLNTNYPWMHASLDGRLTDLAGRKGILEIKTTNILQSIQWEQWKDQIPGNYYIQVLHYLAVTEYDFAVLKAQLKYERDGKVNLTTKHYFIERKEVGKDIERVIEAERRFWNYVKADRRPDLILPAI